MIGSPGTVRFSRLLLGIPFLTIGGIGVLVLFFGTPRPVLSARLWGGPTDGLARFTGYIEAERRGETRVALSGARVEIFAVAERGARAHASAELDEDGQAEISLDFGEKAPGTFQVSIRWAERVLAEGRVGLSAEAWRAQARRRGGYFSVASRGSGALRVAPGRGSTAVPFASPLWIRAEDATGRPASGVRVHLSASGAHVDPAQVLTNSRGLGFATLMPLEHQVTLTLRASGPIQGKLSASVPISAGALFAERKGSVLIVRSPVVRSQAFATLLAESGRLFGARVPLTENPAGIAEGRLALPADLPTRSWAAVESVRGAPDAARIGWPLFESEEEPAKTFDAPDSLLIDGFSAAQAKERDRQRRARLGSVGVALLGALASVLGVLYSARRQRRGFTRVGELGLRLDEPSRARLLEPSAHRVWLAVALIVLGFLLIWALASWPLA